MGWEKQQKPLVWNCKASRENPSFPSSNKYKKNILLCKIFFCCFGLWTKNPWILVGSESFFFFSVHVWHAPHSPCGWTKILTQSKLELFLKMISGAMKCVLYVFLFRCKNHNGFHKKTAWKQAIFFVQPWCETAGRRCVESQGEAGKLFRLAFVCRFGGFLWILFWSVFHICQISAFWWVVFEWKGRNFTHLEDPGIVV